MSARAILIGAVLCVGLGLMLPVTEFYIQGTRLGLSSATPAAFFLLFVILIGPQILLRWLKPKWAFKRGELLIMFAMMSVGVVVCTRGFVGPFFGITTGPAYYAQARVPWAEAVNKHLSSPFGVTDPEAVRRMYEGLQKGDRIPTQAWAGPLAWWGAFVLCMTVLVFSAVALFRKQWIENEHLPFPVARVALALTEEGPAGTLLPPLFRSPIFWIGLSIPVVLESMNGLSAYYASAPRIPLSMPVPLGSELMLDPVIRISFLMLGFAFFIDCRVAFSLWAFYVLSLPAEYIHNMVFFDHAESLGNWTAWGAHGTIMAHQQMGAMLVLVVGMIWAARKHLLDDKGAVVLFLTSFLLMSLMVWQTGVPLWLAPLVVGCALVIWLSLTRLMAQGGLVTIVPAIVPLGFVISAVGIPRLGVAGTVAMGLTTVWAGDLLTFLMGPAANCVFLAHHASPKRRVSYLPLLGAVMLGLCASILMTLHLTHSLGALNLHQQYFEWFPAVTWRVIELKLDSPTGPSSVGYAWTAVGAAVMLLLTIAYRTLAWWPLHPLGYVAQGGWIMRELWFSIFLAWSIKVAILRWGGGRIYKKAIRFFIGMIVGVLVVGGVWLVIDSLTGMQGNALRVY